MTSVLLVVVSVRVLIATCMANYYDGSSELRPVYSAAVTRSGVGIRHRGILVTWI